MDKEEGREGPDDIHDEDDREDPGEIAAEPTIAKGDLRERVETNGESDGGADQNGDGDGARGDSEIALHAPACFVESPKRNRIEDDIHRLESGKEDRGSLRVDVGEFVMECGRGGRRCWLVGDFDDGKLTGWSFGGVGGCGWLLNRALNVGEEAVSAARERFDEAGIGGGVAEGFAQLVDRGVEAVIEIDEGVRGPESLAEFFAGDDFAWTFEKSEQDLERLLLQAEAFVGLAKFAGARVCFELIETIEGSLKVVAHPSASLNHFEN